MSNKYKHGDIVPLDIICSRLDELWRAVTKGQKGILREFDMRIPAELDRDADVIICEASTRLKSQAAEIAKYKKANQHLEDIYATAVKEIDKLRDKINREPNTDVLHSEADKLKGQIEALEKEADSTKQQLGDALGRLSEFYKLSELDVEINLLNYNAKNVEQLNDSWREFLLLTE